MVRQSEEIKPTVHTQSDLGSRGERGQGVKLESGFFGDISGCHSLGWRTQGSEEA